MWKLFLQIIGGILGLFLAERFVPHVEVEGTWQTLVWIGAVLGLLNFFLRPILRIITFPLRILTLGLFGLVINILIVWIVEILFPELIIPGIIPLFWTSLIVWAISYFLVKWLPDKGPGGK